MGLRYAGWLAIVVCLVTTQAQATGLWLGVESWQPQAVGQHVQYLVEGDGELELAQARERARRGELRASNTDSLSFGIGSAPVWLLLALDNPSVLPSAWHLFAGAPWIDRMDFYLVKDGQVIQRATGGDRVSNGLPVVPGLGTEFVLQVPPGESEVWLRVATPDAMVMPMLLSDDGQANSVRSSNSYTYGAIYGFALALLAYNIMLFLGLRQRNHLNYTFYLLASMLTNVAYTGHGQAWLWPGALWFQQYASFIGMVAFGSLGFRFALQFLQLDKYAPGMARAVRISCVAAAALMALLMLLQWQSAAAYLAFIFVTWFSLAMIEMGWTATVRQSPAARYFLLAACGGMVGTLISNLTVWGWLPFTWAGYRAVDVGLLLEATLLGLAVVLLVRQHEEARNEAEKLADQEPLTGLLNRRAFERQAGVLLDQACLQNRSIALIMLDLDHFQRINDKFGHAMGDRVLAATARQIRRNCRSADLAARWGGEAFILMLPDVGRDQALAFAERLQVQFAVNVAVGSGEEFGLTASFGVAVLQPGEDLESLVKRAEVALYRAKHNGRDCIRLSEPAQSVELESESHLS